ncbi:MAG: acetyl esterase [Actinomycetota bacterium]
MSPLHPQVQPLVDAMAAMEGPKLHEMSPVEARAMFEAMRMAPPELPELASVTDGKVPSPDGHVIPIRTYVPKGVDRPGVCVYFHGGGWVIGSIDSHDAPCRELAARSGCAVVSVDYRLSPETKYPGPLDDCVAATEWVAANGAELAVDSNRLAVAGDSAGGNLAAAVTLVARDRGTPNIAAQVLVYPATDLTLSHPSMTENGEGYFLTADAMKWFAAHYGGDAANDALVSPLHADDHSNLPPALVLTAEFDPLRDEGEAYAAKLEAAGVPTTLHRFDGQIHGFLGMYAMLDDGRTALDEMAASLRAAIGD